MGLFKSVKNTPKALSSTFSSAKEAVQGLREASSIQDVVDVMISIPADKIDDKVNQLRVEHPDASPEQLARIVTKQFRRLASNTSGLAGATAAVPGLGTMAAFGVSSAQLVGFVTEAGYYVLTMAHIYGVPVDDMDKRRLLVLSSLMGEQGAEIASSQFGFSTLTALKGYASDIQRQTIQKVNRTLAKQASKRAAKKGASAMFGRLMPFGIGAALGWVIGRSMAGNVIEGVQEALGEPPAQFDFPVTVDVEGVEVVEELSE
ncbi:MAG: hypothetical protein Q4D87_07745 [Actinomycetaceae bacterium]|nr:hypothetical protein [Actinomycetaceae bacterium]